MKQGVVTALAVMALAIGFGLLDASALASARAFRSAQPAQAPRRAVRMSAATATAAAAGLTYDVHADLAAITFDGGTNVLRLGPAACLGYAVGPVTPELCGAASFEHADGTSVGLVSVEVLVEVPAIERALGLPTAPAVGMGWALFRIGDGGGFDDSRRAFAIVVSASVLGL